MSARRPAVKRARRVRGAVRWPGTSLESYKPKDADGDWAGITRQVLYAGSRGDAVAFDVRYFELTGRLATSLERHRHAHVVVGVRGVGKVRIGRTWLRLAPLDTCYIGPDVLHQLRNAAAEPFGFLCVVDAKRDVGRPVVESATRRGRKRRSTRTK